LAILACPEVSMSFKHPCISHAFFPECLPNLCYGLHLTFSKICLKFGAHSLSDPFWNYSRPDTWLQIKGCKNQHIHPAAWNFVHRLPRYANTIIYRCIALLQLLYRWQHWSQIMFLGDGTMYKWVVLMFWISLLSPSPNKSDYYSMTLVDHVHCLGTESTKVVQKYRTKIVLCCWGVNL
jgi:hypothetical protein